MKNTIYKYIFYEFLRYFFVSLFALAVIVWTVQSVNFLDLVTEEGHAFQTFFTYSLLTLSKVLAKLIPFCFMLALILSITKLEKDNEMIIIWTAGLNKIYIVNLIFRISLLIMLLQFFLTSIVNPISLNFSRNIIKNSDLQLIPTLMKEKQFNDSVEGLTIFIEKKLPNGEYHNIFIRDEGKILSSGDKEKSSTIFAKSGFMGEDERNLILYNGNIQKLNKKGDVNIIKFEKTVLNLSDVSTKSISEPKIQETSSLEIMKCIMDHEKKKKSPQLVFDQSRHNCRTDKKSEMDNKIEFNKRFGMPVYIPLISLICSFLLTARKDKKIYVYNKYIYFTLCFIILALAEVLVRYSGMSWNYTAIYYLLPIILLPLFYLSLIRKFKYENLN